MKDFQACRAVLARMKFRDQPTLLVFPPFQVETIMYTGGVHRIYCSSGPQPVLQLYAGSYRLTLQGDQVDRYGEASPCGATLPAACASHTAIMRTTPECDGWLRQYLLDGAEWLLPQYVRSSIR